MYKSYRKCVCVAEGSQERNLEKENLTCGQTKVGMDLFKLLGNRERETQIPVLCQSTFHLLWLKAFPLALLKVNSCWYMLVVPS